MFLWAHRYCLLSLCSRDCTELVFGNSAVQQLRCKRADSSMLAVVGKERFEEDREKLKLAGKADDRTELVGRARLHLKCLLQADNELLSQSKAAAS